MRFLIVLAFASVALAGSNVVATSEIGASVEDKSDDYILDLEASDEEGDIHLSELLANNNARGLIASWEARRQLQKLVLQMPCGWEKYGIPPLAPYELSEFEINFKRGILETLNKIFLLRVEGLDNIITDKLKVNVLSKVIKFDILLPKITITADKYDTNTTFDALRELGVYVQYAGDGALRFVLDNLRITGKMKGKIPLLFGSAKLVYLKTKVTLEKFTSDVTGFVGNYTAQQFFNQQIENFVESTINGHTQEISDFIEETAKSEINPRLKGKDFWTLLAFLLTGNDEEGDPIVSNCVSPANTWD